MNTTVLKLVNIYIRKNRSREFAATRDGTMDLIDFDGDGDLNIVISGTGKTGDILKFMLIN